MGSNYRKELEAGVPGGSIPSGGGIGSGAAAEGNVPARGWSMTAAQKAARDAANKAAQKQLGKSKNPQKPSMTSTYQKEVGRNDLDWGVERPNFRNAEAEYQGMEGEEEFKKGGFVHKSAHYKKHAAGHMVHMDHIKKNFKGK